jgi:hypothetical protein
VFGASAPAGAATDTLVTTPELSTVYATAGHQGWVLDNSSGGTEAITTDVFDARSALKLLQPSTGSSATILKSYGLGVRPADIPGLLAGSSFSYSGSNVNFQLAMFYTPNDPVHYGPTGTTLRCTQAVDGGVSRAGMCFTIIKFEPKVSPSGAYATITLADKQAPLTDQAGGWLSTQSVGQYVANGRVATLDNLLGQMSSYEIYGAGASVGPGTVNGVSWLANLTFGGASYSFGAPVAEAAAASAPAADSAALDQLVSTNSVDVEADTASVSLTGSNASLAAIDATQPVDGRYNGWGDPTDGYVDVYAYSAATFVGTFPVVNGNVVLTGMNLSALAPGAHNLVLRGQTSGNLAVIRFAVAGAATGSPTPADPTLAATGAANPLPWEIGGSILIALGLLLRFVRRSASGKR